MGLRWMEPGDLAHTISGDENAKIYLDGNGHAARFRANEPG